MNQEKKNKDCLTNIENLNSINLILTNTNNFLSNSVNYNLFYQNQMINDNFKMLLTKLKKNSNKQDIKPLVEEFEEKLNNYTDEKVDDRRKMPPQANTRRGKLN